MPANLPRTGGESGQTGSGAFGCRELVEVSYEMGGEAILVVSQGHDKGGLV